MLAAPIQQTALKKIPHLLNFSPIVCFLEERFVPDCCRRYYDRFFWNQRIQGAKYTYGFDAMSEQYSVAHLSNSS